MLSNTGFLLNISTTKLNRYMYSVISLSSSLLEKLSYQELVQLILFIVHFLMVRDMITTVKHMELTRIQS